MLSMCPFILQERDFTNMSDISVNVTQDGIFYTYTMQIMQNVSQLECGSLLSVRCLIGSVVVTDLSKELDNCTGKCLHLFKTENSTIRSTTQTGIKKKLIKYKSNILFPQTHVLLT